MSLDYQKSGGENLSEHSTDSLLSIFVDFYVLCSRLKFFFGKNKYKTNITVRSKAALSLAGPYRINIARET
jgi:hypothetical protein